MHSYLSHVVEFEGHKPHLEPTVFLAPDVWVIGRVILEQQVNVWTGTVIRGDDDVITIGRGTTILEQCLVEAPMGFPVHVGEDAILSHKAVIHGAQIGNRALVGIGAMVLDGAKVGEGSMVGSGAVVTPRTEVPPGKLVLGIPAKAVRDVEPSDVDFMKREHERTLAKAEMYKLVYKQIRTRT